jgi:Fur family peroxide stress response transcriptional regulator
MPIVYVEPEEFARRTELFKRKLRSAGIKLTHQRLEVFREVARSGEHPDTETIFFGVRERMPTISLDTVYRTLHKLLDLGLITTLGPRRESTKFDPNLEPHHHFICRRCGKILDFSHPDYDRLEIPEKVGRLGSVETLQLEVRGICRQCQSHEANFQ